MSHPRSLDKKSWDFAQEQFGSRNSVRVALLIPYPSGRNHTKTQSREPNP